MLRGDNGHTEGIHFHDSNHVRAEKIGNHSSILIPSHIGCQKSTGSPHGAKGAQLRGVDIHHPNQQLNHSNRLSITSDTASI
jgi:hypothetical protein